MTNTSNILISQELAEILEEFSKRLANSEEDRNSLKFCPICGSNIMDRKIGLYKELIDALYKIYRWCGEHRRHEFLTKDIIQFLRKSDYARFGDLIRFGGIIYKPKNEFGKPHKALFGINMKRAKEFFAGQREIPVQITINQLTNEIINAHYVKINEFPNLFNLITSEGLYDYEKTL